MPEETWGKKTCPINFNNDECKLTYKHFKINIPQLSSTLIRDP